ncbi:MAG: DUF1272 domain-containing protein [Candidatus Puniceispirillum sp.]|uniref:DUF1272 domain-containing protein n=2 Tax=Candidatus Puniceispirillum TaxID=767891 RepID=UPI001ECFC731|nr:DUF1272 domain-containing protein [Candidatus Puniceispirillum sp.]MBT6416316.1 DUF1272 domain-containing protein [Candidatus Puniceispirillum sp.]
MLDMKIECEKCETKLEHDSDAFICSFECTYCMNCGKEMNHICKNCNGEIVKRPKRDVRH